MKFELKGYNIDNLLKTLYSKKVTLYNLTRLSHDHVTFETSRADEKKVKRYIKNYKSNLTPDFFRRLPKILLANLGIVLAVFFGTIFFLFLSNYTWQIRIYGAENLTDEEIINVLAENGVKVGKINMESSEEIESILLNNYDRIAQVSVIREGTAIIINISEKLVYDEIEYEPITAEFCGIIRDINLVTGTLNVKVGDYVNIGDILVLPFNIDSNGNKVSVQPFAEIFGEIYINSTAILSASERKLVRTGREITCYEYKIFNRYIFSGKTKNLFALFETELYNENVSDILPLSRDVITYYELDYVTIEHNLSAELEENENKSRDLARGTLPKNAEILVEKTTSTVIDNILYSTTTLTIEGIIHA